MAEMALVVATGPATRGLAAAEVEDPLQRLDQTMDQTPEWIQLRSILDRRPPRVRDTISNALSQECQRSFQNVVGQIEALQEMKEWMRELLESDEAAALNHLMQDIHPSNIHALQRETHGINEDIFALRFALKTQDIPALESRARLVANKAKRFREKFAEFRPKLDRLKAQLNKVAAKCAEKARESDDLIAETEARKEWWWWLLQIAVGFVFGGACLAFVPALTATIVAFIGKKIALNSAWAALSTAKTLSATKAAAAIKAKITLETASAAKANADAALAAAQAAHVAMPAAAVGEAGTTIATGAAVATGAGVASAAVAGAAGVGAPAATFLGSEVLGAAAVSLGLMASPAAPVGVVGGIGAAVAGAVGLLLHLATPPPMEVAATATTAAAGLGDSGAEAAAKTAAKAAADAFTHASEVGQAASQESIQAAAGVTDAQEIVVALQEALNSLTAHVCSVPFVCTGFLLIALALVGGPGRDLIKKLLGKLWAAEIEAHKRTKAEFQRMERVAREAAAKLQPVCESNTAFEQCLDLVVQTAEDLVASADDAQVLLPTQMGAKMVTLDEQVEELCRVYKRVPAALQELCSSLRELQPELQDLTLESPLPEIEDQDSQDDQRLPLNWLQDEVEGEDEGWTLVPSAPLAPLLPPAAGTDCLPPNTYILVPVAVAAQLGALSAAGPDGNKIIEVQAEGQAARLLRRFSLGGSMHELTADHPIKVMRSGNWIQEQVSTLQVGDIVMTSDGERAVQYLCAPRVRREEVFSLNVQNDEESEAYVFSPACNSDGQLCWSGVAVLGSRRETQTSRSAPPRCPSSLPSLGSGLCKGRVRCSNVCRNFKRGSCANGKDCRFCHFDHPEESKRQPRGPRDGGSSRSSQSA